MAAGHGAPVARSDGSNQITIRVHPAIVDRADALVDFVGERTNQATPSRADVWREALLRGIAELEREHGEMRKKRR